MLVLEIFRAGRRTALSKACSAIAGGCRSIVLEEDARVRVKDTVLLSCGGKLISLIVMTPQTIQSLILRIKLLLILTESTRALRSIHFTNDNERSSC